MICHTMLLQMIYHTMLVTERLKETVTQMICHTMLVTKRLK